MMHYNVVSKELHNFSSCLKIANKHLSLYYCVTGPVNKKWREPRSKLLAKYL